MIPSRAIGKGAAPVVGYHYEFRERGWPLFYTVARRPGPFLALRSGQLCPAGWQGKKTDPFACPQGSRRRMVGRRLRRLRRQPACRPHCPYDTSATRHTMVLDDHRTPGQRPKSWICREPRASDAGTHGALGKPQQVLENYPGVLRQRAKMTPGCGDLQTGVISGYRSNAATPFQRADCFCAVCFSRDCAAFK